MQCFDFTLLYVRPSSQYFPLVNSKDALKRDSQTTPSLVLMLLKDTPTGDTAFETDALKLGTYKCVSQAASSILTVCMKLLTLTYSDSSDDAIIASGIRTILRRSSSVGTITTFLFSFEPGAEAKRISSDLILKYFKFFDYPRGVCETKSKGGNFKIVENTEVMYYLESLVFQSLLI